MNLETSLGKFEEYLGVRGWEERPHQRETISKIVEYFETGKKLVMLGAPTGFGKTLCNWSVSMGCESAYYVTGNLSLQDQIIKDEYPEVADIRGRSNYKCSMVDANCSEGLCQLKKKFKCEEECDYKSARQAAMDSKIMLSNLMYFVLEGGRNFKKRELLVVDEGHNLPEQLIGFSSATISGRTANKEIGERALELFDDYSEVRTVEGAGKRFCEGENAFEYLEFILDEVHVAVDCLDDAPELDDKELKEYKRLRGLSGRLVNCKDAGGVIVSRHSTWNGDYSWIVVQPLLARKVVDKLIFSRADKILISSATINPWMMRDELGFVDFLGKGKSVYIPVESTFPKENRPIVLMPVCNFSYKNQTEENQEKMLMAIANIIHHHEGERGIVFCQSYKHLKMLGGISQRIGNIAEYDVNDENVKKEMLELHNELYRRLLFHTKEDRKEVLKTWMESLGDFVLVGVNFEEGLDLRGDIARFSICFKSPFASSIDPRVASRLALKHWGWYYMLAQQKLMQAAGRIVRTETDKGTFYIIDEKACSLFVRKGLPAYIKEAVVKEKYEEWKKW